MHPWNCIFIPPSNAEERWVIEVAKHLPVAVIARMVGEHDTRLWRFIHHYVDKARALEDYSEVTAIGLDETSKKGHNYITVVADLSQRKVIFVTDGKDSTTVQRFAADFEAHRGNDSACLCYAHRIAGNLRAVRPSRRGGTAFEKALQLDDACKARTHEETLRHNPQSWGRDSALLRGSLYECYLRRNEQHYTKHQGVTPEGSEMMSISRP